MSNKWFSGPPPSIGWWPASVCKDEKSLRWWDGNYWSFSAFDNNTAFAAECASRFKVKWPNPIEWQHRPKSWPARSRT